MPFSDSQLEKFLQKRQKRIAASSGCFGSNSKGRRIFETLSAHKDKIGVCFVKDIWDTPLQELKIPGRADYNLVFRATGFKDGAHSSPYIFKEIAYICFPAVWTSERRMQNELLEPLTYRQDLKQIEVILASVGGIEMDSTDAELVIYGYRK